MFRMVHKKSASRTQLNMLSKITKRRASFGGRRYRKASDSLSSGSACGSYSNSNLDRLDNPLVSQTFDKPKLMRQSSVLSRKKLNLSSRSLGRNGRRRRRESSKNSELSKSSGTNDSDTDNELESCFDSFMDMEIDQYVMYNKKGEEVSLKFGHDYLSVNGDLILYEHVIYWGHTKRCFKVSYVENMSTASQDRVDISLYPGPSDKLSASGYAQVLQAKVAALYKEITGCSEDEALGVASKEAGKAEVVEVLNQVDQTSEQRFTELFTQNIEV